MEHHSIKWSTTLSNRMEQSDVASNSKGRGRLARLDSADEQFHTALDWARCNLDADSVFFADLDRLRTSLAAKEQACAPVPGLATAAVRVVRLDRFVRSPRKGKGKGEGKCVLHFCFRIGHCCASVCVCICSCVGVVVCGLLARVEGVGFARMPCCVDLPSTSEHGRIRLSRMHGWLHRVNGWWPRAQWWLSRMNRWKPSVGSEWKPSVGGSLSHHR
jgi:hypothetical protein